MEGKHAPVHDIGAVSLGRIVLRDVGQSADDTLAGRRLLTRGAIAGLIGIDHGADLDGCGIHVLAAGDLRNGSVDCVQRRIQLCRCLGAILTCFHACHAGSLGPVDRLGSADVLGVSSRERELRKSQRIGSEGRRFTRRNQFVCRRNLVQNL